MPAVVRRTPLVAVCIALLFAGAADAAAPPLTTNGFMFDLTQLGDRVYIDGSLDMVGRPTGAMAGFDAASGAIDPTFGAINGQVSDAIPDGRGGGDGGGGVPGVGSPQRAYL